MESKHITYNRLVGPVKTFEGLLGRVLSAVTADDDSLTLYVTENNFVTLEHDQDCCESVYIEDIVGDLEDLVGTPLLLVEEVSNYDPGPTTHSNDSHTWTYYRFRTIKGSVDVRFYGSSNGYYSEGVSVKIFNDDKKVGNE